MSTTMREVVRWTANDGEVRVSLRAEVTFRDGKGSPGWRARVLKSLAREIGETLTSVDGADFGIDNIRVKP